MTITYHYIAGPSRTKHVDLAPITGSHGDASKTVFLDFGYDCALIPAGGRIEIE